MAQIISKATFRLGLPARVAFSEADKKIKIKIKIKRKIMSKR